MRFAVIADIHANCVALDAVLNDLAGEQYDEIICLGDVSKPGPQPAECLERLRKLECSVVMGNHDAWFPLYHDSGEHYGGPAQIRAIDLWCAERLTDGDVDYIRSFLPSIEYSVADGMNLLFFHGSPNDYEQNIFSTTLDDDLEVMLDGCDAMVLVGGHTHIQMLRRKGPKTLVNVGSVGRSFLRDRVDRPNPFIISPLAEYAVIDYNRGRLSVDLRQVPFDLSRLKQIAFESGMPHPEWLLSHHIDRETYVSELWSSKSLSGE